MHHHIGIAGRMAGFDNLSDFPNDLQDYQYIRDTFDHDQRHLSRLPIDLKIEHLALTVKCFSLVAIVAGILTIVVKLTRARVLFKRLEKQGLVRPSTV